MHIISISDTHFTIDGDLMGFKENQWHRYAALAPLMGNDYEYSQKLLSFDGTSSQEIPPLVTQYKKGDELWILDGFACFSICYKTKHIKLFNWGVGGPDYGEVSEFRLHVKEAFLKAFKGFTVEILEKDKEDMVFEEAVLPTKRETKYRVLFEKVATPFVFQAINDEDALSIVKPLKVDALWQGERLVWEKVNIQDLLRGQSENVGAEEIRINKLINKWFEKEHCLYLPDDFIHLKTHVSNKSFLIQGLPLSCLPTKSMKNIPSFLYYFKDPDDEWEEEVAEFKREIELYREIFGKDGLI